MRLRVGLVQKRFRAQHAIIGKARPPQQYAVAADKTIIAHGNRARDLAILHDVDGVRNELRLESGDGGEAADGVAMVTTNRRRRRNAGFSAKVNSGPAFGLVAKMRRTPT